MPQNRTWSSENSNAIASFVNISHTSITFQKAEKFGLIFGRCNSHFSATVGLTQFPDDASAFEQPANKTSIAMPSGCTPRAPRKLYTIEIV